MSISSNKIGNENYDIIRIDRSRKESGDACFIKQSVTYIHKINMCLKTAEERHIYIYRSTKNEITYGMYT